MRKRDLIALCIAIMATIALVGGFVGGYSKSAENGWPGQATSAGLAAGLLLLTGVYCCCRLLSTLLLLLIFVDFLFVVADLVVMLLPTVACCCCGFAIGAVFNRWLPSVYCCER